LLEGPYFLYTQIPYPLSPIPYPLSLSTPPPPPPERSGEEEGGDKKKGLSCKLGGEGVRTSCRKERERDREKKYIYFF